MVPLSTNINACLVPCTWLGPSVFNAYRYFSLAFRIIIPTLILLFPPPPPLFFSAPTRIIHGYSALHPRSLIKRRLCKTLHCLHEPTLCNVIHQLPQFLPASAFQQHPVSTCKSMPKGPFKSLISHPRPASLCLWPRHWREVGNSLQIRVQKVTPDRSTSLWHDHGSGGSKVSIHNVYQESRPSPKCLPSMNRQTAEPAAREERERGRSTPASHP